MKKGVKQLGIGTTRPAIKNKTRKRKNKPVVKNRTRKVKI